MAQEVEVGVNDDCLTCGASKSVKYQCCECLNAPALCSKCIVTTHQRQPLHRIQMWTGTHFDTSSLRELRLVMYLGHNGTLCPASIEPQEIIIVHTNGIHQCLVQYCDCNDLTPNFQQLMLSRLFPATLTVPATTFTFKLLEVFHQLTLSSKITPYDYFDTLKKLTDFVFPQDIEVCSQLKLFVDPPIETDPLPGLL